MPASGSAFGLSLSLRAGTFERTAIRRKAVILLDIVGIKEYFGFMVTYSEVRDDRERCLALTSLTPAEFDFLLPAFVRAYQRRYPAGRTAAGRPRQRAAGG